MFGVFHESIETTRAQTCALDLFLSPAPLFLTGLYVMFFHSIWSLGGTPRNSPTLPDPINPSRPHRDQRLHHLYRSQSAVTSWPRRSSSFSTASGGSGGGTTRPTIGFRCGRSTQAAKGTTCCATASFSKDLSAKRGWRSE